MLRISSFAHAVTPAPSKSRSAHTYVGYTAHARQLQPRGESTQSSETRGNVWPADQDDQPSLALVHTQGSSRNLAGISALVAQQGKKALEMQQ